MLEEIRSVAKKALNDNFDQIIKSTRKRYSDDELDELYASLAGNLDAIFEVGDY
ncbi:hypothetical protein [Algibacillus agarilyticus]|uniref:hypothetical protein n=1 Tax=Algibacillus agarilyticus TaxID=2234133 RepID=UPI00130071D3|nr:hypothetical protein [Algibacillus agarilyticus]